MVGEAGKPGKAGDRPLSAAKRIYHQLAQSGFG
jgi:hypothetical protein